MDKKNTCILTKLDLIINKLQKNLRRIRTIMKQVYRIQYDHYFNRKLKLLLNQFNDIINLQLRPLSLDKIYLCDSMRTHKVKVKK